MKDYIEKLKKRTHVQKTQYAFMASAVITSLIAAVWILAIITNPVGYLPTNENGEVQNLANAGSLFDAFGGFK